MAKILKSKLILCGVLASTVVLVSLAWSHCQIPCGIYNDQMRFALETGDSACHGMLGCRCP